MWYVCNLPSVQSLFIQVYKGSFSTFCILHFLLFTSQEGRWKCKAETNRTVIVKWSNFHSFQGTWRMWRKIEDIKEGFIRFTTMLYHHQQQQPHIPSKLSPFSLLQQPGKLSDKLNGEPESLAEGTYVCVCVCLPWLKLHCARKSSKLPQVWDCTKPLQQNCVQTRPDQEGTNEPLEMAAQPAKISIPLFPFIISFIQTHSFGLSFFLSNDQCKS